MIGPWPPTMGGVTTFMLNVASSRLGEEFEILRYSTSRPPKKNVTDNYGYNAMLRGGILRFFAGAALTALRLVWFPVWVVLHRPDIVQVQSSDFQVFWEASLYVAWSRLLRIPVLMRLGGSPDYFYEVSSPAARRLIRYVISLPQILIVQAKVWRDFIAGIGRDRNVVILPNSVPASLLSDAPHPHNDVPICLFSAGTESVRKGSNEVIAAIKTLVQRQCRVHFRFVAAPPLLQQQLVDAGLTDVSATGYLDHPRLIAEMRSADIFLLPSWGEGFPNALLEAMACNMACIATPVGAIPEMVADDGAIIVPVKDAPALADAIQRVVNDRALLNQLGARGAAIVRERYTRAVVLGVLKNAWLSLLPRFSER